MHKILPHSHRFQANDESAIDNGLQFANRKLGRYAGHRTFDRVCDEHRIEHRLIKTSPSLDQWPVSAIARDCLSGSGSSALLLGDQALPNRLPDNGVRR